MIKQPHLHYNLNSETCSTNPIINSLKISRIMFALFVALTMAPINAQRKTLPDDVIPYRYDLFIDTIVSDPLNEIFRGYVSIHTTVKHSCDTFSLNSDGLTILFTSIVQNEIPVDHEYREEKKEHLITFVFKEKLKEKNLVINIGFERKIEKSLSGYYVSTYHENKRMYSTHFEPTSARSAFPCFDQPDFKAVFRIVLGVPEEYVALSNSMDLYTITLNEANPAEDIKYIDYKFILNKKCMDLFKASPNKKLVLFEDTLVMSTYLVAYAVGDLHYIEDFKDETRIRVYAPKGEEERGKFALDVSKKCLAFFEEYFDIAYPLKKLDHLAVPDFAMGAMENWGLITYRKSSLLMDHRSPTQTKKIIAETVCHELAHQWFGNLATMQWWNDIWLNEGFATWAAALGVERLNLGWDIWSSFINNDVEYGMSYDSLHSTHEIQVEVNDPDEIDQIFDGISYSKGASLIKMLEDYVGAETFKLALRKYLKDFEYKNTTTLDLWERIESISGKEIKGMMNFWTTFKGFPLVEVSAKDQKLVLKQERFYLIADYERNEKILEKDEHYSGDSKDKSNLTAHFDSIEDVCLEKDKISQGGFKKVSGYDGPSQNVIKKKVKEQDQSTWRIPLRIKFFNLNQDNVEEFDDTLFEFESGSAQIEKKSDLYKINSSGPGFYRVKYDNVSVPIQLLGSKVLSVANKLNILNDLFQLSIGSYISCSIPIKASILILKNETNCDLISSGLSGINEIKSIFFDDEEKKTQLNKIALEIIDGRAAKIDLRNAGVDLNEESLSGALLSTAVSNNDMEIISKLNNLFVDYKKDENTVHPNFLGALFTSVIKTNAEGSFFEIWKMYLNETRDDIKNITLSSLGATLSYSDLFMKEIFKDNVKLQDKIYIFASICSNLKKRNDIIDYTLDNFKEICDMFGKNSSLLGYVIEKVIGSISDKERRDRAVLVLEKSDIKAVVRAVDKALEKSAIKIRFKDNNKNIIFNE